MPKKKEPKDLKGYKGYVKERLSNITPILQKASVGDFLEEIEVPEKEDEFSELLVGLSLMMDDLKQLGATREKIEEERKRRLEELEQWRKLTIGRELKMIELKKEVDKLKEELKKKKKEEP